MRKTFIEFNSAPKSLIWWKPLREKKSYREKSEIVCNKNGFVKSERNEDKFSPDKKRIYVKRNDYFLIYWISRERERRQNLRIIFIGF